MGIPQDLKDKWVAALRSGKYKQGRHVLRSIDDCFCCLGVLGDIIDNKAWQKNKCYYTLRLSIYTVAYCLSPKYLPDDIQDILINLNDDCLLDFNKIADWIEENIDGEPNESQNVSTSSTSVGGSISDSIS